MDKTSMPLALWERVLSIKRSLDAALDWHPSFGPCFAGVVTAALFLLCDRVSDREISLSTVLFVSVGTAVVVFLVNRRRQSS